MTPPTVISDPRLRELWNDILLYKATGRRDFILALNKNLADAGLLIRHLADERLKLLQIKHERDAILEDLVALRAAAEKMADAISLEMTTHGDGYKPTHGELAMSKALWAYRSLSPEQQEGAQG